MRRRRLVIGGAVGGGILLLAVVAFFLLFGRIAAWAVRSKVLPRVGARLDRKVAVGDIDADRDRIVLTNVVVSGPADAPGAPLAAVPRVVIEYDFWAALTGDLEIGTVTVEAPHAALARGQDGTDNVRDVIDRLLGRGGDGDGGGGRRGGLGLRPERLIVRGATFAMEDAGNGASATGEGISFEAVAGEPVTISVGRVSIDTGFGPRAGFDGATIEVDPDDVRGSATTTIEGGRLSLWKGFSLTGITGTVKPDPHPGRARVDFAGGYGGVEGKLWTAAGWIDPEGRDGSLDLEAARFTFDRLRPILEGSVVEDFDQTAVDVAVAVRVEDGVGEFDGHFDLQGLTIHHPKVAEEPVRNISFEAQVAGGFDIAQRSVSLTKGDVDYHGVAAKVDGFAFMPGGVVSETGERRTEPHVGGRLVIPTVPCQQMLEVLPPELTPHMQGFVLRGKFKTDLYIEIDWADFDATRLEGSVGIYGCKVKQAPEALAAERFLEPFEHFHPGLPGELESYVIGPDNPDFVPVTEVSTHLINSLMTTEDSRFYDHKGFIVKEFRSALIKNLEAGRFKYGASSITMQTVKNVLLYRDKLLSRKLQELFLVWYLESQLEKDRIMEIYLNAIEFGPGIWGIGPATRHYFGKEPSQITPVEAAFFSSILPGPKPRYEQYCRNKLTRYTTNKIPRIIKKMHERDRLDDYQLALYESGILDLQFAYPEDFSQKACLERIKTYMPEPEPEPEEDDE